jgi:ribosomal protein S18 acetylase RimI-like enzyme
VTPELRFEEIVSLDDMRYDAWLDLYQASFPLNEQVRVSDHNKALRRKGSGRSRHQHLLAALDENNRLIGMARYDESLRCHAAVLWYLAVATRTRGRGVGSRLYREIMDRVCAARGDMTALIFEVQDPETTTSRGERKAALRRIAFYQRNGARLLRGVSYSQSVGWQAPIPMLVMAHPCTPDLDPAQVFQAARCVLGKRLQPTGPPVLE